MKLMYSVCIYVYIHIIYIYTHNTDYVSIIIFHHLAVDTTWTSPNKRN